MSSFKLRNAFLSIFPQKIYDSLILNMMKYKARSFKKLGFNVNFKEKNIEIIKEKRKIILSTRHIVYLNDLKNMFDYYFDSLIPIVKKDYLVLDFSKPNIQIFKKGMLKFYFSSLPEDEWEVNQYLKHYKLKKGDIVFDVGSYCGYSVYNFSKKIGASGHLYSFEPDDENYKILKKNLKLHAMKNVTLIKNGLWSETKELAFFNEGSLGSSVKEIGYRPNQGNQLKIKALSFKDAFIKLGLKKLDFVKMDIEGAEVEVIKGSLDFIRERTINFAIACHPIEQKGTTINTSKILKELFRKIGYKAKIEVFKYNSYETQTIYAGK